MNRGKKENWSIMGFEALISALSILGLGGRAYVSIRVFRPKSVTVGCDISRVRVIRVWLAGPRLAEACGVRARECGVDVAVG